MKTKSILFAIAFLLSLCSYSQNITGLQFYKQIAKKDDIVATTEKSYFILPSYQYDMFLTIKIDSISYSAAKPYMKIYFSNNGVDYALYSTDSLSTTTTMFKEFKGFGFKYMKVYFNKSSATKLNASITINAYKNNIL